MKLLQRFSSGAPSTASADPDKAAVNPQRAVLHGDWDEVGQLQLDYLRAVGLDRTHRLLDIGCGSLRGGVKFIDYLLADHYYGIDANIDYLRAGIEIEIQRAHVARKLPEANVRLDDRFDFAKFGVEFDMAIAHGLFAELSLNDVRLCLYQAARVLSPDARLFATLHEAPELTLPGDRFEAHETVTSSTVKPYHYSLDDLAFAADGLGWKIEPVGEWGHPSGERLVAFRRTRSVLRSPRTPGDTAGKKTSTAVVDLNRDSSTSGNRVGTLTNRVRRFSNRQSGSLG